MKKQSRGGDLDREIAAARRRRPKTKPKRMEINYDGDDPVFAELHEEASLYAISPQLLLRLILVARRNARRGLPFLAVLWPAEATGAAAPPPATPLDDNPLGDVGGARGFVDDWM